MSKYLLMKATSGAEGEPKWISVCTIVPPSRELFPVNLSHPDEKDAYRFVDGPVVFFDHPMNEKGSKSHRAHTGNIYLYDDGLRGSNVIRNTSVTSMHEGKYQVIALSSDPNFRNVVQIQTPSGEIFSISHSRQ